jgi:hypothetical protein
MSHEKIRRGEKTTHPDVPVLRFPFRPGLLTLAAASLTVLVPWTLVRLDQPAPRQPVPPPPLAPGELADVLIVLVPGDPAWPERPPAPDATTQSSPVIYNTEIIAREVGDELSARGITVTVLPAEQIGSARDVLGHRLVLFAFPARRFALGAGFQRFLDEIWEETVRDYPAEAARSRYAALVISATDQWAESSLNSLAAVVSPVSPDIAERAVFLTSAIGNDVISLRDDFAARLAELVR